VQQPIEEPLAVPVAVATPVPFSEPEPCNEVPPAPITIEHPVTPVPTAASLPVSAPVIAPTPLETPEPVKNIKSDINPASSEFVPRANLPEVVNEEPKAPLPRSDYPLLQASTPSNVAPPPTRSWAGLFTPTDNKQRPLARVPPYGSESATNEESAPAAMMPTADLSVDLLLSEDPYTVRLGEALRAYKLDHRALNPTPRGLTNRSNWCYVNAILQALIACPSFYNLLKALPVPENPRQSAKSPITCAL